MLRGEAGPHSNVDLLVEFQPGHTPGWEIVDIEEELSRLFGGRNVPELVEALATITPSE